MATNVYQMVTDRIIAQMEKGVIPWKRPWRGFMGDDPAAVAVSHETGRPYSLLNQFLTGRPGEYITFPQIQARGGRIRKGEKCSIIVFWGHFRKKDPGLKDEDGNPKTVEIPILRYYNVWNIDQCEGIAPRWTKPAGETAPRHSPVASAEAIVEGYLAQESHPTLRVEASSRACYSPRTDTVTVPNMEQYDDVAEYYSTLFHELGHSTGHGDRLARKGILDFDGFGGHEYSKEELVAEITSAMLMAQAGIAAEGAFKNSVAYLQGWMKRLRDDPKMVVWAAGKAEAASKWILGIHEDQQEAAAGEEAAIAA